MLYFSGLRMLILTPTILGVISVSDKVCLPGNVYKEIFKYSTFVFLLSCK